MSHSPAMLDTMPTLRVILGPAPCASCGAPLVFGYRYQRIWSLSPIWMHPDGTTHLCLHEPWDRQSPPVALPGRMCSACRRLLPLSDFGTDCQRKDGLNYRCRVCVREVNRIASARKRATRNAREAYNEHVGSSDAPHANIASTPFGSLTLSNGVVASRGQD